ncbi:MAG: hypothetical protein F2920_07000 [Actinobacteria bacterium]|uniref:Unannotated protein n=1 Tax=freshwater metagenome TaxID=449393 RepID=A0A6J6APJ9_9ZZZZ|nr:hypothetical protein [Actinomycetota bacterium]
MVRRAVLAVVAIMAVVVGSVVASTPAGAVVDTATVVPSPNPGVISNVLNSVSCVSASWCAAVGEADGQLTLAWDGTSWTEVANPGLGGSLMMASCATTSSCFAFGYSGTGLAWDGVSWAQAPSPLTQSGVSGQVLRLNCFTASRCIAVGAYLTVVNAQFYWKPLVLVWDGTTWTRQVTPSPGGPGTPDAAGLSANNLAYVSCVAEISCTAVGTYDDGTGGKALILVWDGLSWTQVTAPNLGTSESGLISVSCVSASWCSAVGQYNDVVGSQPLVLVWDGVSWSQVASPNLNAPYGRLVEVSCVSTSSCVAVGEYGDNAESKPLVLVWDGVSWTQLSSPNLSSGRNYLSAVSCVSASLCTAVGLSLDDGFGHAKTLVVSLTTAPPVPTPDPVAPAFTG